MNDALKAALVEKAKREKARRAGASQSAPTSKFAATDSISRLLTPLDDRSKAAIQAVQTPNAAGGAVMEFVDGALVGAGDEIVAGMNAMLPGDGSIGERYDRNLSHIRKGQENFQDARPVLAATARVAGAVASPAAKIGGGVKTIKGAAAVGGGYAAAEGFAEGEGGLAERALEGAKAAPTGFLFSGLTSTLFKGASAGVQRVFDRAEKRPTVENLKAAKNTAYAAVRRSGEMFDQNDTLAAFNRLTRKAKTARWDLDEVSELDKPAFDALRVLQRRAELGRPISLNTLDKTRQKLWDNYRKSEHPFVLEAISEIDGMVDVRASASDVMRTAREANSRYAKAQLLENAFQHARWDTAKSGSGGNVLNNYRAAIVRILKKPQEAKWFSDDELALMEQFVMGDAMENTLRRAGKMAPGGNGLMTALNVYAASVDPSLLAVTAAASAAKGSADRSAMRGSERLLDRVSTGVIQTPKPKPNMNRLATGSASVGNALSPF